MAEQPTEVDEDTLDVVVTYQVFAWECPCGEQNYAQYDYGVVTCSLCFARFRAE